MYIVQHRLFLVYTTHTPHQPLPPTLLPTNPSPDSPPPTGHGPRPFCLFTTSILRSHPPWPPSPTGPPTPTGPLRFFLHFHNKASILLTHPPHINHYPQPCYQPTPPLTPPPRPDTDPDLFAFSLLQFFVHIHPSPPPDRTPPPPRFFCIFTIISIFRSHTPCKCIACNSY